MICKYLFLSGKIKDSVGTLNCVCGCGIMETEVSIWNCMRVRCSFEEITRKNRHMIVVFTETLFLKSEIIYCQITQSGV